MLEAFAEPAARLPDTLGGHMRLALSAIGAGLLISLPLGAFAARRPWLTGPTLAFAGVMQTIPSLALLALMVPLLGGMIGFWPAFLALTLYAILPVLRNTIVGLEGVDPRVREAARGVGMTRLQTLARIDLPLALPTIVAGVRTGAVWVIGTATLATPVGAASLGSYIFEGLQTRTWTTVIFGCIAAASLALILDQLIRALETAAGERRRGLAAGAASAIAVLAAGSLLAPAIADRLAPRSGPALEIADRPGAVGFDDQRIIIGAKTFTEQYILARALEARLRAAGARTERRENLGSTVAFDALVNGEIDVYVDYTGTLWETILDREDPIERHAMFIEVSAYLYETYGILTLGRLGFENAYGFAVTRETAEAYDLSTIGGLNRIETVRLGGDPEFFARAEWTRLQEAYGLARARPRPMDSTFMYDALVNGEVEVITAYTTDGRIDAFDLVVLEDPAGALPPYDAVLLLSPEAAGNPALIAALEPFIGAISDARMRMANAAVDLERRPLSEAAALLLDGLGGGPS